MQLVWVQGIRLASALVLLFSLVSCTPAGGGGGAGPLFEINSPSASSTIGGTLFFSVQPANPDEVASVRFQAGGKTLTLDPSNPFRAFLSAKDYPAGNLSLQATLTGKNGATRQHSITVTNVPNPPSNINVGSSGAVLGSAENGTGGSGLSTLTLPPGVAQGAALSFATRNKAEVKAATGVDYDAMGVTFLGAQQINSSKPLDQPIGISSGGFGPKVQPGQVVVNYAIAPDANGDGVGELVVINTASVAPNGDVVADPVTKPRVSGGVSTQGVHRASLHPQAVSSGAPGTRLELEVSGFNPLSATGNVAIYKSSVNGSTIELPGLVIVDTATRKQTFVSVIPLLPVGGATLVLKNSSTNYQTPPMDFQVQALGKPSKSPKTILWQFLDLYPGGLAQLEAEAGNLPEEYKALLQTQKDKLNASLSELRQYVQTLSDDDPKLIQIAAALEASGILGSLSLQRVWIQAAGAKLFWGGLIGFGGLVVTGFGLVLTSAGGAGIPVVAAGLGITAIGGALIGSGVEDIVNDRTPPPSPLDDPGNPGPTGPLTTGMGSAPPPGGTGNGNIGGGGASGASIRKQATLAQRYAIKIFPLQGSQPSTPFTGFSDAGGYFFVPLIPQDQPFRAIAYEIGSGQTRTFSGIGPKVGKRVLMFFDFSTPDTGSIRRWDGGGDGVNWSNAKNWSDDILPGPTDQVVIDVPAQDVTIHFSGINATIAGLTLTETLNLVSGRLNLEGAGSVEGTLKFSGGQLGGVGTLSVNGLVSATSGYMGGPGKTILKGRMEVNGVLYLAFDNTQRTIDNQGTLAIVGTSNLYTQRGSVNNLAGGMVEFQGDGRIGPCCGAPAGTFNNAGTLRKTGGSGKALIADNVNNTGGKLWVQSGNLELTAPGLYNTKFSGTGGNFEIASGAVLHILGSPNAPNTLRGTYTGSGAGIWDWNSGAFAVPAGEEAVISFSGGVRFGDGYLVSGTLKNTGLVIFEHPGNTSGGISKDATFANAGSAILRGTKAQYLFGNFNNLAGGTLDIQSDVGFTPCCGGSAGTFSNAGTVLKSAGSGTSSWLVPFINQGTLQPRSGSIQLTAFTQTSSGVLDLEIGGAGAVTDYDQLKVSGAVNLAGTLKLSLTGGYVPPSGQSFDVLLWGSRANPASNVFTTLQGPINFTPSYNDAAKKLTLTTP